MKLCDQIHDLIGEAISSKDISFLAGKGPGNLDGRAFFDFTKGKNNPRWRLEKDGWFRLFEGEGKGHGIMIRSIKLGKISSNENFHTARVHFKYLKSEFDDMPDNKANWASDQGVLWITKEKEAPSIEDLAAWINKQQKVWVP